jgi:uncharacterized membrane protein YfcA
VIKEDDGVFLVWYGFVMAFLSGVFFIATVQGWSSSHWWINTFGIVLILLGGFMFWKFQSDLIKECKKGDV